ncbi:MAG TPA: hypothetical protein VF717_18645 [Pyrinomonadaceae bacterium]|jgi:hypothetical protein
MSERIEKVEPFTWKTYEACLSAALESGYSFIGFERTAEGGTLPDAPFILLRHDIDYDPSRVLPISTMEADKGIRATYFFQADSPFYRLDDPSTLSVIREVLKQGHNLGLHFDANSIEDDGEIVEAVERTAREMESRFETSITAVSFHMPGYRNIKHLRLRNNRINTYSPVFFEKIEYVSDSNQNWRGKDLLQILRTRQYERIQVLTHPIWWRETYSSLYVKIEELAAKLGITVDDILTDDQRALIRESEESERAAIFASQDKARQQL